MAESDIWEQAHNAALAAHCDRRLGIDKFALPIRRSCVLIKR